MIPLPDIHIAPRVGSRLLKLSPTSYPSWMSRFHRASVQYRESAFTPDPSGRRWGKDNCFQPHLSEASDTARHKHVSTWSLGEANCHHQKWCANHRWRAAGINQFTCHYPPDGFVRSRFGYFSMVVNPDGSLNFAPDPTSVRRFSPTSTRSDVGSFRINGLTGRCCIWCSVCKAVCNTAAFSDRSRCSAANKTLIFE